MKPKLPRPLLWADLQFIDEFFERDAINVEFNKIIKTLFNKKLIPYMRPLKVFNELYYILSRYNYEGQSPDNYRHYVEEIKDDLGWEHCDEVVMIMIFHYIQHRTERDHYYYYYSILDIIYKELSGSVIWGEFESKMNNIQLPQPEITPQKPSPVTLKYLEEEYFDWSDITYGFDLSSIKEVLMLWEDKKDKMMIAAMIEKSMDSVPKSYPSNKQKFQEIRDYFRTEKIIDDSTVSYAHVESLQLQSEVKRLENRNKELEEKNSQIIAESEEYKKKENEIEKRIKELEEELVKAKELDKKRIEEIDKWHGSYEDSCVESDMWKAKYEEAIDKEPVKAFNAQTGVSCFTSRQMGIFLTAVGILTEKENPPAKTTLGEVVEKIAGYKATTVNQNMKGKFSEKDIQVIMTALKDKLPNLAEKVSKL